MISYGGGDTDCGIDEPKPKPKPSICTIAELAGEGEGAGLCNEKAEALGRG